MVLFKNISIKVKLFLILFLMLFLVALCVTLIVYYNAQGIVEIEMYEMNQKVLDQVSKNISLLISDITSINSNLANDSKLNEILTIKPEALPNDEEELRTMTSYVEGLLSSQTWTNNQYKVRFDAYVRGNNGLVFSTDSSINYEMNLSEDDDWLEIVTAKNGDVVYINTYEDPKGMGAYHYVFQVVSQINDLLTNEPLGILVINVSEKLLFDTYSEMMLNDISYYIVDSKGTIISSGDKRDIQQQYKYYNENIILKTDSYSMVDIDEQEFLLISNQIQGVDWFLVEEIPRNSIRQPLQMVFLYIIVLFIFIILLIVFMSTVFSIMLTRPILNIKSKMEEVVMGNLNVAVKIKKNDEIGELGRAFNLMVKKISGLLKSVKEEEQLKRLAELDLLFAQINPHFIYNTLSSIRFTVAMGQNDKAEDMIYLFTKIIRNSLSKESEFISINEEIENIKIYERLQSYRYPNCFDVKYCIDNNLMGNEIPKFIIQPILENAIFYGITDNIDKCIIKVSIQKKADALEIVVKDNGKGMSKEKVESIFNSKSQTSSIGLKNVQERIKLIYGNNYGINIKSEEGKSTEVIITIPMIEGDEEC